MIDIFGVLFASASPWSYVIPVIVAVVSGSFVAFISRIFDRKKTEAETTEIVTKAAAQVLTTYAEDNKRLRAQVTALEEDNRQLKLAYQRVENELFQMRLALKQAGLDPTKIL